MLSRTESSGTGGDTFHWDRAEFVLSFAGMTTTLQNVFDLFEVSRSLLKTNCASRDLQKHDRSTGRMAECEAVLRQNDVECRRSRQERRQTSVLLWRHSTPRSNDLVRKTVRSCSARTGNSRTVA